MDKNYCGELALETMPYEDSACYAAIADIGAFKPNDTDWQKLTAVKADLMVWS